ncbi:MAG: hypothetical protein ACKO4W_01175, partial [Bacteroidota bacterium]
GGRKHAEKQHDKDDSDNGRENGSHKTVYLNNTKGNDFYESSAYHFKAFYLCGYFFAPCAHDLLWKTKEFSLPELLASSVLT